MNHIRCPNPECRNIVAMNEGEKITCRIAVRGRNRLTVEMWGRARFTCDRCGRVFEFRAADAQTTEGATV